MCHSITISCVFLMLLWHRCKPCVISEIRSLPPSTTHWQGHQRGVQQRFRASWWNLAGGHSEKLHWGVHSYPNHLQSFLLPVSSMFINCFFETGGQHGCAEIVPTTSVRNCAVSWPQCSRDLLQGPGGSGCVMSQWWWYTVEVEVPDGWDPIRSVYYIWVCAKIK